jgi:DNA helicase-2/ATP-dependent DNA helicase PcrA
MLDLTRLTPEQREVVLAGEGPLLVVAGPGSGKTAVLAARIAYLVLARGVAPEAVLALTSTAAAARRLRARLRAVLAGAASAVPVSTFHALGLGLLRRWPEALGLPPGGPRVCDAPAALGLLRRAARAAGVDPDGWRPLELAAAVERLRRGGPAGGPDSDPGSPAALAAVARAYEAGLRGWGAVDYPAMLALPLRLFEARPEALGAARATHRAVLVDEAQDLCPLQYELVRRLAAGHRHLALVADPRQAIYAWRGADVRLLGAFLRDFPEARLVALDQNFRATGRLVGVANALGAALGFPPTLWTANPPGEPARLVEAADERAEARAVAAEVGRLGRERGVPPADVAVLYRTRRQGAALSAALAERGLPCRVRAHAAALAAEDPALAGGESGVLLATIHAAQGGEWPVVFVAGVEEGLLPHARALTGPAGVAPAPSPSEEALAEELRVAFVAVTRPRALLYLTRCRARGSDSPRPRRPSRFLRLLPPGLVDGGPAPHAEAPRWLP